MDAKIRKHQHTLVIAGYATILFGIWDVAKSLLNLTLNESLYEMIENNAVDFPRELMLVSTVLAGLIVFIVLLISISIRLAVGRAAIRLGMGETRKCGAMVFWSVIILLTNAAGVVFSVIGVTKGEDILNMAGSFLVDLTSLFMMIGILTALYKLRKLNAAFFARR